VPTRCSQTSGTKLPFLDYLRLAFRWAGFPGLDRHAERRDVQDFVARFSEGLLPF
jgi:hypothetical protein